MKLDEFIAATLVDVSRGLREANRQIAADWQDAGRTPLESPYFSLLHKRDAADRGVKFNVAVTAASKLAGTGKGSVEVLSLVSIGGDVSREKAHEEVSRVEFIVHVEQLIF